MAKKRRTKSFDIRPPKTRIRKSWASLSSSGKSYWRSKLDSRPARERRTDSLDRMRTATQRARYTKPVFRTPYQRRVSEPFQPTTDYGTRERYYRDRYDNAVKRKEAFEKDETAREKKTRPPYGYKLEEFLNQTPQSNEDDYTYVTYHLFITFLHKGIDKKTIFTVRGQMYNTREDLADRVHEEISEVIESVIEHDEEAGYLYTIVQVIPSSGKAHERLGNLPGGVYNKDYEPREKAAGRDTRKVTVEKERQFLKEFGPNRG